VQVSKSYTREFSDFYTGVAEEAVAPLYDSGSSAERIPMLELFLRLYPLPAYVCHGVTITFTRVYIGYGTRWFTYDRDKL
jgi:hypothetical protein